MKYLKIFEKFENSDFENKIEELWKIDPYYFRDMVVSCMDEVDLYNPIEIYFHATQTNSDNYQIFVLDEFGTIKPGIYFDNMDSILKSKNIDFAFELFIYEIGESNEENGFIFDEMLSKFEKCLKDMLDRFGLKCKITEYWISDETICFLIEVEK